MQWTMLHPKATMDHLGFIPSFLSADDPRPAREQLDANYQHGGGWRPMKGFHLFPNNNLKYPGDPIMKPIAWAQLRDETIVVYDCCVVAIIQPDRSFEAARMD